MVFEKATHTSKPEQGVAFAKNLHFDVVQFSQANHFRLEVGFTDGAIAAVWASRWLVLRLPQGPAISTGPPAGRLVSIGHYEHIYLSALECAESRKGVGSGKSTAPQFSNEVAGPLYGFLLFVLDEPGKGGAHHIDGSVPRCSRHHINEVVLQPLR